MDCNKFSLFPFPEGTASVDVAESSTAVFVESRNDDGKDEAGISFAEDFDFLFFRCMRPRELLTEEDPTRDLTQERAPKEANATAGEFLRDLRRLYPTL
jgi:hypothetical protein